jgi:DNA invertase Pin-like site-specific DNA recombinase
LAAVGYATVERMRAGEDAAARAHAEAVRLACRERGLVLLELVQEVEVASGPDLARPRLLHALKRIASGEAGCLVVPTLDRLSRSAVALGTVMDWLDRHGARLVVADLGLDTGATDGQVAARVLSQVAELERRRGAERGAQALASAVPRRASSRPSVRDRPALARRIVAMREQGMTLQAIADTLNAEAVPTLRGGTKWRPSSVQSAAGYKRPRRGQVRLAEPGGPAADDELRQA